MILDDEKPPTRPWDPWRDGILHALLIGAATAIGTEIGKWGVERVRKALERPKPPAEPEP